jgi:localization factor PodJL
MNSRTSWSAKKDRRSIEDTPDRTGSEADLPLDELLDARFDEEGRLSQGGRGNRQRVAERLDAGPPAMSADELERAVQKLAQGLEAIERQGSARARESKPASAAPPARSERGEGRGRDFVTYSLDRLEARLEALSKRLEQRATAAPTSEAAASPSRPAEPRPAQGRRTASKMPAVDTPMPEVWRDEPSLADEPRRDPEAARAETLRRAEEEAAQAKRLAQQVEAKHRAEAAEAKRQADEAAEARRQAEAAEAHRQAEAAAEARRQAEAAEVRRHAEAAEARRQSEAAAEARRKAEAAEARYKAEAEETRRRAELAERREAEAAAEMKRQFAALEARIEALQLNLDDNQVEPVRRELTDMLRQIAEVGRDGRSIADALEQLHTKLEGMESKFGAARSEAGERLSELQGRLSGLTERLGEMEAEVPGFDALRENQSAILERFDRMEDLVQRLATPEQLLERVEGLRRSLQSVASQREVARIEEQMLAVADRLDALPETISDAAALERIEGQLQMLAGEFAEARRQRISGTTDLQARLSELAASLQAIGEMDHSPDLSGLEQRLSDIAARVDDGRRLSSDALARLDRRLAALAEAVERQEDDASAEVLAALTRKMDALADAIDAQDAHGTRRDLEALDRKLDQLHASLDQHAAHLSRPQLEPLEERLDQMQLHLEEFSRRTQASTAQFGPFAQKLQEISDRVSGIGANGGSPLSARLAAIEERLAGLVAKGGPDPRALQTQLEGIVSRLELLKGRSIDPARLTELFDRVDAAIRAGFVDERFERIEKKLESTGVPAERFDRLEKKISDSARTAVPDERFDRLERKIAESARAAPLSDERFDRLEKKIAEGSRGAITLERFDRLEQRLDAGMQAGSADTRFAQLEAKLDALGRRPVVAGDATVLEDLGELRGEIIALRRELRSLPGLGEGEANLATVLKTITDRLDRLPEDSPATTSELEAQIDRIALLLEDPTHSRLALAHIESSLKAIEERLEDTRRTMLYRDDDAAREPDHGEIDSVAGIARALSDDVSVLRNTTEASERKTKDALEAVQSTLEAVVKRMAFLERDAEASATPDEEHGEPRGNAPTAAISEPPVLFAEPPELEALKPEMPREPAAGSLFSRFTSSQLLKRATGGRTESFLPDQEEGEEAADLPLEPGTDAPLNSALTGAPSSDTARMSGSRTRARASLGTSSGEVDAGGAHRAAGEPVAGDDFLAAARRAARAAAAEVADTEPGVSGDTSGLARFWGRVKGRRRVLLASALAVAIAFAALQIVRNQMSNGEIETAAVQPGPTVTTPVEPTPAAPKAEPEPASLSAPTLAAPPPSEAAAAPAVPESSPADGLRPEETTDLQSPEQPPSASAGATQTASLPPPESVPALPPAVASAPPAPMTTPEASTPAATPEASTPEATPEASVPAAAPETSAPEAAPEASTPPAEAAKPTVAAGLPAAIGPDRLRQAAMSGDAVAAFEVAARYAEGRGSAQDLGAAVAWYKQSAESGLAPAQYRLGSIYEKGLGVTKDLAEAQDWYRRAADAGNVKAMHNLAVLYAEGAGGQPDLERAADLFRKAAERGVRDSQFNLAILHARGLGVPQDMIEAYKWFAIAAGSGDPESLKRRDIIGASLSESDLAKGQAAAAAFQPLPLVAEANDVTMPEGGWGDDLTSMKGQSENDLVALVQKLLAEKGFDPGPTDGLLGRQTMQAITAFQQKAGLPKTGVIDTGLVAALKEQPT